MFPSLFLALFSLAAWGTPDSNPPKAARIDWQNKPWDDVKTQAKTENKLFFVDFDASYCMACRQMDQSTFLNSDLAKYMKENVLALKLDVQDFQNDGIVWSQQYEVEELPTMLIFDARGKLVTRITGYKTAPELTAIFQKLRGGAVSAPATSTPSNLARTSPAPAAPKPAVAATPAPKPVPAAGASSVTAPKPVILSSAKPIEPDTKLPSASGSGLYEFNAKRQPAKGFAVQLGMYYDYVNVMDAVGKIQESAPQNRIFVNIEPSATRTGYRVMLYGGSTETEANALQKSLKTQKINGIVRDLATLGRSGL